MGFRQIQLIKLMVLDYSVGDLSNLCRGKKKEKGESDEEEAYFHKIKY